MDEVYEQFLGHCSMVKTTEHLWWQVKMVRVMVGAIGQQAITWANADPDVCYDISKPQWVNSQKHVIFIMDIPTAAKIVFILK